MKVSIAKINRLKRRIISEIDSVIATNSFREWLDGETFSSTASQFVAINNSFIFREKINTVKSQKFIAFDISQTKVFDIKKIYIIEGINFNSQFKLFAFTPAHTKTLLENAIKIELEQIGEIIYTLVGEVQDVNNVSTPIQHSHFKKITLNPTLVNNFEVNGDEILIQDYADREFIWTSIENYCNTNNITVPENFPTLIDKAISIFQDKAFSTLVLPNSFNSTTNYFLDKISVVIDNHLNTYRTNLVNITTDQKAMNELLRISYNFVSDINKLLILVVNLCDLKPIVMWLTLSKYFILDEKFKDLPFGFSNKKASLNDYVSVIKNARNKSFHQLFPFNKSLQFELQALGKVNMTIFSAHGNKDGNKMKFKDQELYNLLQNFTRVNEQVVSTNFWTKNEMVMQAIHELIIETSVAIKSTK